MWPTVFLIFWDRRKFSQNNWMGANDHATNVEIIIRNYTCCSTVTVHTMIYHVSFKWRRDQCDSLIFFWGPVYNYLWDFLKDSIIESRYKFSLFFSSQDKAYYGSESAYIRLSTTNHIWSRRHLELRRYNVTVVNLRLFSWLSKKFCFTLHSEEKLRIFKCW